MPAHKKDPVLVKCFTCECFFRLTESEYRWRLKKSRKAQLYCSIECFTRSLKVSKPIAPTKVVYSKDLSVEKNTSWIEHKTDETKWRAVLVDIKKVGS
jgi:hypothetical protein